MIAEGWTQRVKMKWRRRMWWVQARHVTAGGGDVDWMAVWQLRRSRVCAPPPLFPMAGHSFTAREGVARALPGGSRQGRAATRQDRSHGSRRLGTKLAGAIHTSLRCSECSEMAVLQHVCSFPFHVGVGSCTREMLQRTPYTQYAPYMVLIYGVHTEHTWTYRLLTVRST